MSPLPRFLLFYGALFAAFGVASPFLPGLLQQSGLGPGEVSLVLAAGAGVRLLTGPLGGWLADRTGRAPLVLSALAAAAAAIALGYGATRATALLVAVSAAHAAVLAPLNPVADALALGSAEAGAFRYGWIRGAGSAAFIAGTLLSGRLVDGAGLGVIVGLNAALLAAAAAVGWMLPNRVAGTTAPPGAKTAGGIGALFRLPTFGRVMAVAALIGGSHALHDTFEVIRWRAAGLSATQASILWSLSVASELVVFVGIGPPLLAALGPRRAMLLAGAAGIVRWSTAAVTAAFPAMVLVEPLHGLTFALLHLACMDVIGRVVPAAAAATAQTVYATVAIGAATAMATGGAGPLYEAWGPGAFWVMAALCAAALPLAVGLRNPAPA